VVDNKNNNTNTVNVTDPKPVIPNINTVQNKPVVKTDVIPGKDVTFGKDNLLWSYLENDYWFSDCLFTLNSQNKFIRCVAPQTNKPRPIEIKNDPNKKLSALSSALVP
jgi:hypothetical protein